ncbi:hypothetical protein [Thalassococcus lentus]|uniref:DUF4261 domain-containing protein n=1 Tax=Thalassococcus lentus TaxID=1210524 RepID=A0ABT4XR78_9RHOB|nr:hypothetical protein [Thalassococcus lentus]MDA7424461.1 hypothetical protein [Thalassococcus lentus]
MTDRPDTPTFSAYVLLSEALQFNTAEIRNALLEDFPDLDIRPRAGAEALDQDCDTNAFITAPILLGGEGKDALIATAIRLPGYGTWSMDQLSHRQTRIVPDMEAALAQNASYICVSVGAASTDMMDCFRAARLCSCLAAIFAKLPVALAVYWESADHFLPTERIVQMADTAMQDKWPITDWISYAIGQKQTPHGVMSVAGTRGLLPFKSYETSHAEAPVSIEDAAGMVHMSTAMVLEYGHVFQDGHTLGHEGQSPEQSYRIRYVPAGTEEGVPFDVMMLVHPSSPLDHEDLAGPLPQNKGPVVQDRGRPGVFQRLMGKRRRK